MKKHQLKLIVVSKGDRPSKNQRNRKKFSYNIKTLNLCSNGGHQNNDWQFTVYKAIKIKAIQ